MTLETCLLDQSTISKLKSIERTPLQPGDTVVPPSNYNYKMKVVEVKPDETLVVCIGKRQFPWTHPYVKLHAV